jgi:tetratricopeptide (TPR) repeat protein
VHQFLNKPLLISLITSLLLTGCSQLERTPAIAILDFTPDTRYVQGELNADSLYQLLSAELAGKRGRFDLALENYLNQARLTQDPGVAERATRIAQFLRRADTVLEASQLWSEIDPENIEPLHIRANILLHERQFEAALPLLEQVLELGADEALMLIAAQADEMPAEVAQHYYDLLTRLNREQPEQLDYLLTRVLLLRQMNQTTAAAALLDEGLRIEPAQAELVLQRAEIYRQQGQPDEGLKLVQRALRHEPEHTRLAASRAQLLLLSGQTTDAWDAIKQLLNEQHDNHQLRYYFALLLLENNQLEQSRQLLLQLLDQQPDNSEPHFYLGVIAQQQEQQERALEHYLQVDQGPNLIPAHARALSLFASADDEPRVSALIEAALVRHPDHQEELTILYVEWLDRVGQRSQAVAILNRALEQSPDSVNLLYTRAMLTDAEQSDRMINDLRRALLLSPDNPMVQNALGYTLTLYTDQLEEAHALISRALAQQPEDAAILDSMGWVLHKLGRNEEALPFLQQAHARYPDPEVTSHLVQVLWALGQEQTAVELLQQALEQEPDSPFLLEAAEVIGLTP